MNFKGSNNLKGKVSEILHLEFLLVQIGHFDWQTDINPSSRKSGQSKIAKEMKIKIREEKFVVIEIKVRIVVEIGRISEEKN